MATTPSTNFDFDSIKQHLIDGIKTDPTFTDYNFEGSALNALMDILANNTFNNAFLASASHAENFIDSAQRRSSVVSRGTEMGYTPISARCSSAYVNITANNVSGSMSILRGTKFQSTNENGTYTFSVASDYASTTAGANQQFNSVKLIEGTQVQNYFRVNTDTNIRSIFTIPNQYIDTSTLRVFVRDSLSSTDRVEYTLADVEYGLQSDSTVFFLQESYGGFYQIFFGGDVIGKQPTTGMIIDVDYFVVDNFAAADGCRLFEFDGTFGTASSINIVTTQESFGGSDKESIDSIKINAKKSNSAKFRSVKESDYELMVKKLFPFVRGVSVWGGENNVPPVYGKVFFALQPTPGYTISDSTKRDVIVPAIRKSGVMTITPVIVDPEYLLLEFITNVKFNGAKTTTSQEDISSIIKNSIRSQVDAISSFNSDLIQSTMTTKLSQIDAGVSGVSVDKRVAFRVSPLIDVKTTYTRSVNNQIVAGSIASTKYKIVHNGLTTFVSIREVPNSDETITVSGVTQITRSLGVYTETGELVEIIGTVNLYTGRFSFTFALSAYASANRFVHISMKLESDDVLSFRNQILTMDSSLGDDVVIGLVNNNIVQIEAYNK